MKHGDELLVLFLNGADLRRSLAAAPQAESQRSAQNRVGPSLC
jgi:hypothetical protein